MPTKLEITSAHNPMIHDPATKVACVAEKVMDMTADCPKATSDSKCIFLYTRTSGGQLVQITRPYEGEVYLGSRTNIMLKDINTFMNVDASNDIFAQLGFRLGLSKPELRTLIETHAPPA